MKLGSLFDGSGGFPLAGTLCGIEPVWAAEVEPYPIAVTRSRFPNMKHLGDISKVNGAEIEPVDIITFGSPCQDLSVAGLRRGLKHESNGDEETTRSGLFMEAIRIIKEMREATNGTHPTFILWENVHGAFSSNKGEDFKIVLEEIVKIKEPTAVMPEVPQGGWAYADCYWGDGWSVAYRTFDAQYWGVPQRRRRIYLVADFTGQCAKEVLFERKGLRGYFAAGRTPWQDTSADAEGGIGADDRAGEVNGAVGFDGYNQAVSGDVSKPLTAISSDADHTPVVAYTMKEQAGCAGGGKGPLVKVNKSATIATNNDQYVSQPVYSVENHPADSRVDIDDTGKVQTLTSRMGTGGGNVPMVMEPFSKSARARSADDATTWKHGKVANTLNTFDMGEVRTNELVVNAIPIHDQATRFSGNRGSKADDKGNGLGVGEVGDPMNTLTSGDKHGVVYALDRASFNQGQNAQKESEIASSCKSRDYKDATDLVTETQIHYIVRRLTPTECARLQGFPDRWGWVTGKKRLTDDEYRFWLDVRKTHDAITGKKVKEYTPKQMLTWYNKLWTDSSEYKMWGNGIALPNALYCMQGIAEALRKRVSVCQ